MVCIYEMLGTSGIVYAVLVSGGNPIGVPLTLFCLILMCDKITGAHFNPGVSTAVWISSGKMGENTMFYLMILLSQFLGGLLGVFWGWLILMPPSLLHDEHNIPDSWIPKLCPSSTTELGCDWSHDRDRAAFFFQFFCSFIFYFVIALIKGKFSSPSKDGILKPLAVGLALMAMVNLSGLQGGACYNPAVALGQIVFGVSQTTGQDRKSIAHYAWVFLLAPLFSGVAAGIVQRLHDRSCEIMDNEGASAKQMMPTGNLAPTSYAPSSRASKSGASSPLVIDDMYSDSKQPGQAQ